MATYGVQVFDAQGRLTVGFDNPTVIIDTVLRPDGQIIKEPVLVNGFSITFWDGNTRTYTQRSGVQQLVAVAYHNDISGQTYADPYVMGWHVLEVG